MRITDVETIPLFYPMPYPLTYARGEYRTREALLVRVHTDDPSIIGWGEAAMWGGPHAVISSGAGAGDRSARYRRRPAPARVPLGEGLPDDLLPRPQGHLLACLSGLDIALWDIVGKCAAQPLWRLLGGFARPLSAYASAGYYRRDYGLDDFAADVADAASAGYRGYKMKIGNIPQVVHGGVLSACRCAIPSKTTWSASGRPARRSAPTQSHGRCQHLARFPRAAMRYAAAMEPLTCAGSRSLPSLRTSRAAPSLLVAPASRSPASKPRRASTQFARLIDAGAVQVVQFDVVQVGGFTEARKIAAYAQMRHLAVTAKNYSTAVSDRRHLAASLCPAQRRLFRMRPGPQCLARRARAPAPLSPGGRPGGTERPSGPRHRHRRCRARALSSPRLV